MKLWAKIGLGILGLGVVAVGAGAGFLFLGLPKMQDPPDLKVEGTPEQVAEGEYLANHVMVCTSCHGDRDLGRFGQPVKPGTEGKGGQAWDEEVGFPGTLIAPNITPHHLEGWSDGEIARAITDGVDKDGRPLFPIMSYTHYRHMCQEDLERVIAYTRSLPSIEHDTPPTALGFPLNLIVRMIPQPSERPPCPDVDDPVARGHYLTEMAGCKTCHTRQESGRPVEEEAFAGGFEFPLHDGYGTSVSANITPHDTGIGGWTEETFVQRFRGYTPESTPIEKGDKQSEMPWPAYANMRDEDLKAIYAYLQTVEPVDKDVKVFIAP